MRRRLLAGLMAGLLVFMLAVLPMSNDSSMHLMRAEVPGPTKGKLVPRMRTTAVTLYLIYVAMSLIQMVLLWAGGMPLYEAITYTDPERGINIFAITNDDLHNDKSVDEICWNLISEIGF